MSHPSLYPSGFFSLAEHGSPNVSGFLYWLCSRADPRCRNAPGALRDAGNDMLLWLLRNIAGEQVESIRSVRLFTHACMESFTRTFLLINDRHALRLSGEACPDDVPMEELPAAWQTAGIKTVPVCCEEMHSHCDLVEDSSYRLTSWGNGSRTSLLSLKALAARPLLAAGAASIHPLINEFRDCIIPVVAAEERFTILPPSEWDQPAWLGFCKVVARKLGAKIYLRPFGTHDSPFCRLRWNVNGMECLLEDGCFSVEFEAASPERLPSLALYDRWLELPQLVDLGIRLRFEDYAPRKHVRLLNELPEQDSFTLTLVLLDEFRVMMHDGRVNIPLSIGRVSAAAELLGRVAS